MSKEKLYFKEIEELSKKCIKDEVEGFIKDKAFRLSDCDFMIKKLTDRISEKLVGISSNFKYIINVILLQNSKKNFTQNIFSVFDTESDGIITLHFPFKEITCIVNLMATSI